MVEEAEKNLQKLLMIEQAWNDINLSCIPTGYTKNSFNNTQSELTNIVESTEKCMKMVRILDDTKEKET